MAESISNQLLLEHLKAIQSTQAEHGRSLLEIKERLGILEMQYASLSRRIDRLEERLSRVEARLGLVEG
jgi:chromosome segregation ATPase